jgi:hypothetical protein
VEISHNAPEHCVAKAGDSFLISWDTSLWPSAPLPMPHDIGEIEEEEKSQNLIINFHNLEGKMSVRETGILKLKN